MIEGIVIEVASVINRKGLARAGSWNQIYLPAIDTIVTGMHQPGGAAVTAGAPAVLGAAGFTSSGVAGGSLAAAVQVFDQLT